MKKCSLIALVMAGFILATTALAIDRNADMIDSIKYMTSSYDQGDTHDLALSGETALADAGQNWSFLVEGQKGILALDSGDDYDSWALGLGLKFYLTKITSLALIASYGEIDFQEGAETRTGTARLKQRFLPSTEDISPFVAGSAAIQEIDAPEGFLSSDGDVYSELILKCGIGCDFMLDETTAIVIEAYLAQSEATSSDISDSSDGWTAEAGMSFYW